MKIRTVEVSASMCIYKDVVVTDLITFVVIISDEQLCVCPLWMLE